MSSPGTWTASPELLLRGTFIHLPGIGPRTEECLWRQGITSWADFLNARKVIGMSPSRKAILDREIAAADEELASGRYSQLVARFGHGDLWRLYPLLEPGARFLDIETDGLARDSVTTVVGISKFDSEKGISHRALIRGMDLTRSELGRALEGATVLVTFNGSTFDLPVLRREFGDFIQNTPHIDLRHVSRKAGLSGGLKSLERRLGICRDPEVQMLAGEDAVRLWRVWTRKGHKRALELLVDYNREDAANLAPLASTLYKILGVKHIAKVRSVAGRSREPPSMTTFSQN